MQIKDFSTNSVPHAEFARVLRGNVQLLEFARLTCNTRRATVCSILTFAARLARNAGMRRVLVLVLASIACRAHSHLSTNSVRTLRICKFCAAVSNSWNFPVSHATRRYCLQHIDLCRTLGTKRWDASRLGPGTCRSHAEHTVCYHKLRPFYEEFARVLCGSVQLLEFSRLAATHAVLLSAAY